MRSISKMNPKMNIIMCNISAKHSVMQEININLNFAIPFFSLSNIFTLNNSFKNLFLLNHLFKNSYLKFTTLIVNLVILFII
jgi:hypothetical protein